MVHLTEKGNAMKRLIYFILALAIFASPVLVLVPAWSVVTVETCRNDYAGTGITGPFPFTFKVFNSSEVEVVMKDPAGTDTVLASGTDYTVTMTSATYPNTGSVTLTTALATGYNLAILRNAPYLQAQAYSSPQAITASSLNAVFDKIVNLIQQLKEASNRSPQVQRGSTQGPLYMPQGIPYGLWGWDATGLIPAQYPATTVTVQVAQFDTIDNYAYSFAAAVAAIGASEKILTVDRAVVADTSSIPANITVLALPGSRITATSSFTINRFQAGKYQVFAATAPNIVLPAGSTTAIYPEWAGAVGDLTANDTVALQTSLTLANGSAWQKVAWDGHYLTDKVSMANGYIDLNVAGTLKRKGAVPGDPIIQVEPGANHWKIHGGGVLDGGDGGTHEQVALYGYGIQVGYYSASMTADTTDGEIYGLEFKNFARNDRGWGSGDAIIITGYYTGGYCPRRINVHDCTVNGVGRDGVTVYGLAYDVQICHNSITLPNRVTTGDGQSGIHLEPLGGVPGIYNALITDNIVWGGQRGISVQGTMSTVTGNKIGGASVVGIQVGAASSYNTISPVITNNTVNIDVVPASPTVVNGIHGYPTANPAVSPLVENSNGRVEGNTITASSTQAIGMTWNIPYTLIDNNRFVGEFSGVNTLAVDLGYLTIRDNVFYNTSGTTKAVAIDLNSSGNNTIGTNQFYGTYTTKYKNTMATDRLPENVLGISFAASSTTGDPWLNGAIIDNTGAAGPVTVKVHKAFPGRKFTAVRTADFTFRIDPQDTELFRGEAAGHYLELDTITNVMKVECFETGIGMLPR
jgi:hypothetical protein